MAALEKGACIEIAFGDLKEVQLIELLVKVQGDWLLQRKKLNSYIDANTEMGFQIQELKTELKN